MLKNRVKRMQKEFTEMFPAQSKALRLHLKYNLKDWSVDDIRKVIFPKGREYFDPTDEALRNKWNDTDWGSHDYLSLLTVEELRLLEDWLERKEGTVYA